MKIRPVVAQLFYEDRWTDVTKLVVAFQNCANAPKCVSNTRRSHVYFIRTCIWYFYA